MGRDAAVRGARFCDHRVSCTLQKTGIDARRCQICCSFGEEEVKQGSPYRPRSSARAQGELEAHFVAALRRVFAVENEVLLTTSRALFEGQAVATRRPARLFARYRPDCKQVCIALVVTFDGFPLGYEVFPAIPTIHEPCRPSWPPWRRAMPAGAVWITDGAWPAPTIWPGLRATGGLHHRSAEVGAKEVRLRACSPGRLAMCTTRRGQLTRHPETEETVILCRSPIGAAKSRRCTTSSVGASKKHSRA